MIGFRKFACLSSLGALFVPLMLIGCFGLATGCSLDQLDGAQCCPRDVCCPCDCDDCVCPCPDPLPDAGPQFESKEPEVNREATDELKTGDCPCRQPQVGPVITPQPRIQPSDASTLVKVPDDRQGIYACTKCKRKTVGAQWHTVWTEEGGAATYMCEHCWAASTPDERTELLISYLERNGVKSTESFIAAVKSSR